MPRVRTRTLKSPDTNEAADAMAAFVSGAGTKRNSTGLARQITETKEMQKSGDWSRAKASHLVALYVILHEQIYGVAPELKGEDLKYAKLAAGTLLKSKCGGNFVKALEFMKWVWKRERGREAYRRKEHIDGKVLGWRLIFRHPAIWIEYRVGQERRKHG